MIHYEDYFKCTNNIEKKEEFEIVRKNISEILKKIEDKISREIYINCLMYSMTSDVSYIRKNILLTNTGKEFYEMLQNCKEEILIYGAGERGERIVKIFPEINWGGYIDKNKKGKLNNLSITNIEELYYEKEVPILITVLNGYEDIEHNLMELGYKNIITLEKWNDKVATKRYFEERCISLEGCKGYFIDGGSYDGEDTLKYINIKNESCEVCVFEPDSEQMKYCHEKLVTYQKIHEIYFYEAGLSNKKQEFRFLISKSGLSCISESGEEIITTLTIDEVCKDKKVGFIKLDVEGFEEKALQGAQKIIRQQKPLLAVSIYHKRDDIYDIPKQILEYNPSYKFALGHYSIGQVDTVIYAY